MLYSGSIIYRISTELKGGRMKKKMIFCRITPKHEKLLDKCVKSQRKPQIDIIMQMVRNLPDDQVLPPDAQHGRTAIVGFYCDSKLAAEIKTAADRNLMKPARLTPAVNSGHEMTHASSCLS